MQNDSTQVTEQSEASVKLAVRGSPQALPEAGIIAEEHGANAVLLRSHRSLVAVHLYFEGISILNPDIRMD